MATYRVTICDRINAKRKFERMQIQSSLTADAIASELQINHDKLKALGVDNYGTVKVKAVDLVETYFFDTYARPLPPIRDLWNKMEIALPFMGEHEPVEVKE